MRRLFILLIFLAGRSAPAERINHAGRLLGALPVVTNTILFNTPEADAVVSAMQIFPVTHAWNEDISGRPRLTNSDAMMLNITTNLSVSRRFLVAFYEMNYVLVPDTQAFININFDLSPRESYPDESDPSPYPIPANMPIETWPRETGSLTLNQWQEDTNNAGGDRHAVIVQPGIDLLWEMWQAKRTNGFWEAACGAKWDMNTNGLRPVSWTSADAAGLPMFGGLVRYDECQRGMVEHACRLAVAKSRNTFIYPATHKASSISDTNTPAMGQRLRLKSNFVIPDDWTLPEKAVLRGLKKYGALVSDNGGFFSVSVVPDQRWSASDFTNFVKVALTNFEVVLSTGQNEGPRSPGAPAVDAGPDQRIALDSAAILPGVVTYTNGGPLTLLWTNYSGPGSVAFNDPAQPTNTAGFSTSGVYTLRFSADDGVHAVAYDAVVVTVEPVIVLELARGDTNTVVSWRGGETGGTQLLEKTSSLILPDWTPVATNGGQAIVTANATSEFFRVRQP